MPIQMSCSSCSSRFQFPDEYAGKSARCQKCGETFVIAAPAVTAPVEEPLVTPVLVAAPPTAVTVEPPKAPPIFLEADEEELETKPARGGRPPRGPSESGRRPRRDRPRQAAPSAMPWIMGAVAAFVLLVGGAATFAIITFRSAENRVVQVPIDDFNPDVILKGWDDKKFGGDPDPIAKKDWQPFEAKKEEPRKELPKARPVEVSFKEGKFETLVQFDAAEQPQDNQRLLKEFLFEAKADTVYWISAPAATRAELRVSGPGGEVGRAEDRFRNKEMAFLATKAGAYTLFASCFRFEAQPFKLDIKEMDGREPLPNHLKIAKAGGAEALPTLAQAIKLNVYDKQFTSAAFAPNGKHFWIAHSDSTLSRWENPGFERKGGYKTPGQRLFAMCVDGKGRLYAQTGKGDRGPVSIAQRGIGDIDVYEGLDPQNETAVLPAPTKRIPLGGIVKRLLHSADGRWIYGLDTHNRRLFRIDTDKGEIDREVKNISTSTRSFCLTPDGKTIYCCSETNRIDVVDVAEFKLVRSVTLDKGQPVDIGATNEGIVFLAGQPSGHSFEGGGNAYLVDLTGKPSPQAIAMPYDMGVGNGTVGSSFVCMLPDQRAVLVSGDRAIVAVDIPARPALFRLNVRERYRESYNVPGQMIVSPDGRTLLYDNGTILSISR